MSERLIGVDVGGTKVSVAVLEGATLHEPRIRRTDTSDGAAPARPARRGDPRGRPGAAPSASRCRRSSTSRPAACARRSTSRSPTSRCATSCASASGCRSIVDNDATCAALAEAYDDEGALVARHLVMFTSAPASAAGSSSTAASTAARPARPPSSATRSSAPTCAALPFAHADDFPQPGLARVARRPARRSTSSAAEHGIARGHASSTPRATGTPARSPRSSCSGAGSASGSPTRSTRSTPTSSSSAAASRAAGELLLAPAREEAARFVLHGVGTKTRDRRRRATAPRAGVRGAALLAGQEARARGGRGDEDRDRRRPRRRAAARRRRRRAARTTATSSSTSASTTTTRTSRSPIGARRRVRRRASAAILVCGSGAGVSVAACKLPGIRAAVCHDHYTAGAVRQPRRLQRAVPRRARDRPGDRRRACAGLRRGTLQRRGAPRAPTREDLDHGTRWTGGEAVTSVMNVNERLAALTEAGTSVWLDQIRRSLTAGRRAAPARRGGLAARRDVEPGDLREGDPRLARLRRADRAARPRGPEHARRLPGDRRSRTSRRPPTSCARSTTSSAARTASSRSRSIPTSRSTPSARSRRRASTGDASTGPNVMIKIPGTDGVPAGDRAGDLRGHQRQRHAAVRRRGVRGASPRRTSAASSAATPRACRSTCARSRRSSSRASTRRSTSASRSSGRTDLQGKAAIANARAAYQRFEEIFHGPRFADLLRGGRARCSARCGRRPASRTRRTRTRCTSRSSSAPRPSTRCRCRRCMACAERLEVRGATVREDPAPVLAALAEAGHRHGRRHRQAPARRHRRVRDADGEAARRHRGQARGDLHGAPGDDRRLAAVRARGAGRRDGAPRRGRGGRAPDLEEGPDAVGPARSARGRQPARLAAARPRSTPSTSTTSRRSRAALSDEGYTDAVLLGMGGSSLAPEVLRLSFGERQHGRLRLHVLDSTDPGAVLAVQRSVDARPHDLRRLDEVRRDDRDDVAVRALLVAAAATASSTSRSPTPARRWRCSPPIAASGARSSTTPTSAGATAR